MPALVSAPPASRPAPLPALTGLRFLAAFGVLLFHFPAQTMLAWPRPFRNLVTFGYLGVPLFFVLSGFVLAYNYFPRARAGLFHRREFWIARFARIYPLYAVALVLGAIGVYLRDAHAFDALGYWTTGAVEVTMQQIMAVNRLHILRAWNAAGWTLSVEAYFYLAFPALLGLATWGRKRIAALAAVGALVVAVNYPTVGVYDAWVGPLAYGSLFIYGMALARAHELGMAQSWRRPCAWAVALAIFAAIASGWGGQAVVEGACTALFGLLIWALADGGGRLARLLGGPPLVALGEASYALYILQIPLAVFLAHFWVVIHRLRLVPASWTTASMAYLAFYCAVCIGASLASVRWIERPARRWVQRRFAPLPLSAAAAASGR